jgi:hypothetical protein
MDLKVTKGIVTFQGTQYSKEELIGGVDKHTAGYLLSLGVVEEVESLAENEAEDSEAGAIEETEAVEETEEVEDSDETETKLMNDEKEESVPERKNAGKAGKQTGPKTSI